MGYVLYREVKKRGFVPVSHDKLAAYLGSTNDGSEGALGLRDGTLKVVKLLLDCCQCNTKGQNAAKTTCSLAKFGVETTALKMKSSKSCTLLACQVLIQA
jgi:hypothetical protein